VSSLSFLGIYKLIDMDTILKELAVNGIYAIINHNNTSNKEYYIDGFYKSGLIKLVEIEGKIFAHSRYNTKTEILSIKDLIHLNFLWWKYSKDLFYGWALPNCIWLTLLIKEGLIDASVINKYPEYAIERIKETQCL